MNKKWALFFSGQGTNLHAVLKTFSGSWKKPPILVTNNPKSPGIQIGLQFGLDTLIFGSPIQYKKLSKELKQTQVERIFLLGFLKIIPPEFISDWSGMIFNLHPSLLPKYPGLNSIKRAYDDKSDIGISIHRVVEGVDQGEILDQQTVFTTQMFDHLSLEEVKTIVHSKEHQMVCDFILKGETQFGSKI